jgi:hypothetical protein
LNEHEKLANSILAVAPRLSWNYQKSEQGHLVHRLTAHCGASHQIVATHTPMYDPVLHATTTPESAAKQAHCGPVELECGAAIYDAAMTAWLAHQLKELGES